MHRVDELMLVPAAQKSRNEMTGNASKGFGGWLARLRHAHALRSEFVAVDRDQVAEIARDVGLEPSQLRALSKTGIGAANLLNRMLAALGIDPASLNTREVGAARDLQSVCSLCASKTRCRRALATGTAAATYRKFCPNAATFDALAAHSGDQG